MGKTIREIMQCLSACHCRWFLRSKCCKSECTSEMEEYPETGLSKQSPIINKKSSLV